MLILNRLLKLNKSFDENAKFLKKGKFIINKQLTFYVLNDPTIKKHFSNELRDKHNIGLNLSSLLLKTVKSVIRLIVKKNKYNNQSNQTFFGDAIMVDYQMVNIKIFDVKRCLILIKYFNKKDYLSHIDKRKYFSKMFLLPKIIKINKMENYIIEEKINYKKVSELKNDEIEFIAIDYLTKIINFHELHSFKKHVFLNDFGIPIINVHGDFSLKNIMFVDKFKIYYIDFDLDTKSHILFDFFTLILSSKKFYNINLYLENYYNSKYDVLLEKLFKIFGIIFYPDKKKEYLNFHIKNLNKIM